MKAPAMSATSPITMSVRPARACPSPLETAPPTRTKKPIARTTLAPTKTHLRSWAAPLLGTVVGSLEGMRETDAGQSAGAAAGDRERPEQIEELRLGRRIDAVGRIGNHLNAQSALDDVRDDEAMKQLRSG